MSTDATEIPTQGEPFTGEEVTVTTKTVKVTELAPRSIGAALFLLAAFLVLLFTVVGTPITWFSLIRPAVGYSVKLWTQTVIVNGTAIERKTADDTCQARNDHLTSAEAVSIISIIVALVAVILGIAAVATKKRVPLVLGGLVALIAAAATLVTWAIMARLYYVGVCGNVSYLDQGYELDGGMGLFVAAFVLSIIAAIVAFVDPKIPGYFSNASLDRIGAGVLAATATLALIFIVIANVVPFAHYYTAWSTKTVATDVISVTPWKIVTETAAGTTSMLYVNTGCAKEAQAARFAEAFLLITIGTTLVAAAAGVAGFYGKVGKKVMLPLSCAALLTAILAVGAVGNLYYGEFCGPSLFAKRFRFLAGGVLAVTTLALMALATLVLVAIALYQLLGPATVEKGNTKWSAFLFLVGTLAAVLLLCIGVSGDVYSKSTDGVRNFRVTFIEVVSTTVGNALVRSDFPCTQFSQYINGALALTIISILIGLAALGLGVAQLLLGSLRVPASAVNLVASVTNLTAWALAVGLYYRTTCNDVKVKDVADLGTGLQLIIAAWCITLVVSIINLVIAP